MIDEPLTMLVRVKPYNKKKGHLTRRWTFQHQCFYEDKGWYEVPTHAAMEMAKARHPSTGKRVFDVATKSGAVQLEIAEERAVSEKRGAKAPHVVHLKPAAAPVADDGPIAEEPADEDEELDDVEQPMLADPADVPAEDEDMDESDGDEPEAPAAPAPSDAPKSGRKGRKRKA